ncbi:MAG: septum site-determining protein MinC [Armatimonadetes bacterium]|nr:septum site-determining protein MinC [Armatimonadota bacterium]
MGRLGLAEHQGRNLKQKNNKQEDNTLSEQTLLIKRTLRSGQKINFSGNVVVLGDINPGAEVIAGGDIVAMGAIRGMVHAGAQNSQASILALKLHPAQLRIGDKTAYLNNSKNNTPEIAKIINEAIVILPFGN